MPVLIKLQGKPPIAISGIGTAPALATVEAYRSRTPEAWEKPGQLSPIPGQGIKAAILPGALSGLLLALEQYGTKSFAEVVAPAIEYADGFPLGEEFAAFIRNGQRVYQVMACFPPVLPALRRASFAWRSISGAGARGYSAGHGTGGAKNSRKPRTQNTSRSRLFLCRRHWQENRGILGSQRRIHPLR